jgi:hypothetical protein
VMMADVDDLLDQFAAIREGYRASYNSALTKVEGCSAIGDRAGLAEWSSTAARMGEGLIACNRLMALAEEWNVKASLATRIDADIASVFGNVMTAIANARAK